MEENHVKRMQSKKKLAIIVMTLIILAVVALAYYYTEGTKKEIENTVVLAVSGEISPVQREALAARLSEYAPPDERGPVEVELFTLPQGYEDPQGAQLLQLIDVMNAGNPNLYFFDQQIYQLLGGRVQLQKLEGDYPSNVAPENASLILANKLEFWTAPELLELPDCYLAIQQEDTYAVTKDAQTLEYYKFQRALLDNIVTNQPGKEIEIFG